MTAPDGPRRERRTIGVLARQTGCHVETIRFYERIGLLAPPPRTQGGHRVFDDSHARRLVFVRRCRELGFSLDDVRGLLGLVDTGDVTCAEVKALTVHHRDAVRHRIEDLRRMEGVLTDLVQMCAGGTAPDCAIIETLFEPHR
ncbi:MAG TPA: helix-turn-helix domain-containing protein [Rhodospirillales bacterium]|jgi:MerR family mercuric resistance operon transcriptional regulator|nr:helix-turn-helix domain-containing protein [Rhodospirillales bacterium]HJO68676.1 helix-turn-helix domain-containing protein [Rhodospirillales bacterium]